MRKKNSWMQRLFYWICWLFSSQCFVSRNYQKLVTEEKRGQPREKDRWINLMKSSNDRNSIFPSFPELRKKTPKKNNQFFAWKEKFFSRYHCQVYWNSAVRVTWLYLKILHWNEGHSQQSPGRSECFIVEIYPKTKPKIELLMIYMLMLYLWWGLTQHFVIFLRSKCTHVSTQSVLWYV